MNSTTGTAMTTERTGSQGGADKLTIAERILEQAGGDPYKADRLADQDCASVVQLGFSSEYRFADGSRLRTERGVAEVVR